MLSVSNSIKKSNQKHRPSILAQAFILIWGLCLLFYFISILYASIFENTIITKEQTIVNKAQEVKQIFQINNKDKFKLFVIDVQMGRSKVAYLFDNEGRYLQYYYSMLEKNGYSVNKNDGRNKNEISVSKDGWNYVIKPYNEQKGWKYVADKDAIHNQFLLIIEKENIFNNIFPFLSLQMTNRKIWLTYNIFFILSNAAAGLYFTYCFIKWR